MYLKGNVGAFVTDLTVRLGSKLQVIGGIVHTNTDSVLFSIRIQYKRVKYVERPVMKYEFDYKQPREIDEAFSGDVKDHTVVFQFQTVPFEALGDAAAKEMVQDFLRQQGVFFQGHTYSRKPVQLRKVEVISL